MQQRSNPRAMRQPITPGKRQALSKGNGTPHQSRLLRLTKFGCSAIFVERTPIPGSHDDVARTHWLQDHFFLHGATSSAGGCAIFMMINSSVWLELCTSGSFSALGANDRATSVIGRAIRLGLINILDVRPGGVDRSTLGHPGKISFCVTEDEEGTGWLPLSVQRDMPVGSSTVTVLVQ